MLIQLNLLYASHEDAEEPKLLFPPAIVQGECQLPEKKKLQTAIGEGAEIRNLGFCKSPRAARFSARLIGGQKMNSAEKLLHYLFWPLNIPGKKI